MANEKVEMMSCIAYAHMVVDEGRLKDDGQVFSEGDLAGLTSISCMRFSEVTNYKTKTGMLMHRMNVFNHVPRTFTGQC